MKIGFEEYLRLLVDDIKSRIDRNTEHIKEDIKTIEDYEDYIENYKAGILVDNQLLALYEKEIAKLNQEEVNEN